MENKRLIIIVTSAVFILMVVSAIIMIFGKKPESTGPTARPTSLPGMTYYPRPSFPTNPPATPTPIGWQSTVISGVRMNDFYKSAEKILDTGDVVIKTTSTYQVVYLPKFGKFIISILDSPFESKRQEAENALLKVLGIGQTQACHINVEVSTPRFANPSEAGKAYPLSYCLVKSQ